MVWPPRVSLVHGLQITLPYLDPAMSLPKRKAKLQATYGFDCRCFLCEFQGRGTPSVASSGPSREALMEELRAFGDRLPLTFTQDYSHLPSSLLGAFDESLLSSVTESFSRLSHEGPFLDAIQYGEILRGLYRVIYPPLYPLIGKKYYPLTCLVFIWVKDIMIWNWQRQSGMPSPEMKSARRGRAGLEPKLWPTCRMPRGY